MFFHVGLVVAAHLLPDKLTLCRSRRNTTCMRWALSDYGGSLNLISGMLIYNYVVLPFCYWINSFFSFQIRLCIIIIIIAVPKNKEE